MEKQQKWEQTKKTGASNVEYDLFTEVSSLLKGNAALERYVEDARDAGDQEAESCFRTIHDQNAEHVVKLRRIVAKYVAKAA